MSTDSSFTSLDATSDPAGNGKATTEEIRVASQSPPSAAIHGDRSHLATVDHPTRYEPSTVATRQSLSDRAKVTITIDPDMILAAEDQARSMGVPFKEWCQQILNDALRTYLGI
jgi:hypothetical protein